MGQCSKPQQCSKFSCLVFVRVEKQRFGDANFSGGEMILIGLFFGVGYDVCSQYAIYIIFFFCTIYAEAKEIIYETVNLQGAVYD